MLVYLYNYILIDLPKCIYAKTATGLRCVTTKDAVAAFVCLLRDPEVLKRWHEELKDVRKGR